LAVALVIALNAFVVKEGLHELLKFLRIFEGHLAEIRIEK
jgi:hypothetical protein